jgi:uncharacterized protein YecE (DUF72 family)
MTRRDSGAGGSIRVGCAGWALSASVAGSFPSDGTHLERYARAFSCVEINSSFYRSHQAKTYVRWKNSVPDAFRFSVKMPRTITHESRLETCESLVRSFLQETAGLEEKLGCVLVQLPPSLALDINIATDFFEMLRRNTSVPVACEPRHASWFTPKGAAVLGNAGVSCVWADPPPIAGVEPPIDRGMLYLRLHGSPQVYYSAYDDAFIERVAGKMRETRDQGRAAWCIFDNTARGEAIPNALALASLTAT